MTTLLPSFPGPIPATMTMSGIPVTATTPHGPAPARMSRGFGYSQEEAQARTGIRRHGLTPDDLEVYTGNYMIPAGTTLEGYLFTDNIDLRNGGITVRNSLIRPVAAAEGWFICMSARWEEGLAPVNPNLVEDCEFSGELLDAAGQGWLFGIDGVADIVGCDIHHLGAGIAIRNSLPAPWQVTIASNYIHDLSSIGDGSTDGNHVDGFSIRDYPAGAGRGVLLENNWIDTQTENATGSMFIQAWGDVRDVVFNRNLFSGNGYNFMLEDHGGTYGDITVTDNRFAPTGFGVGYRNGDPVEVWEDNYLYDPDSGPLYRGSIVAPI